MILFVFINYMYILSFNVIVPQYKGIPFHTQAIQYMFLLYLYLPTRTVCINIPHLSIFLLAVIYTSANQLYSCP